MSEIRIASRMMLAFERLAGRTGAGSLRAEIVCATLIGTGLVLIWVLVFTTNGTSNVFLHALYVPIIAASLTLGVAGGAATALIAGFIVGPLMPMNVELSIAQPIENTIYRTGFFLLVALSTAALTGSARRRFELLEESRRQLADISARNLRLFARLVSERDEQTGGHCERVAHNTVMVARALGIEERNLKTYYWAGMLHDLGKLGVPEAILRKSGRLTTEEFDVIKQHPAFGETILLDISESFASIAAGVRSHHERWDGNGYPDGRGAECIPLLGRVIAVVDVFEAVTSFRPYRGPMSVEEARTLIRDGSGTHFDPIVADLFLRLESTGHITRESIPEPMYNEFATIVIESAPKHPSHFS